MYDHSFAPACLLLGNHNEPLVKIILYTCIMKINSNINEKKSIKKVHMQYHYYNFIIKLFRKCCLGTCIVNDVSYTLSLSWSLTWQTNNDSCLECKKSSCELQEKSLNSSIDVHFVIVGASWSTDRYRTWWMCYRARVCYRSSRWSVIGWSVTEKSSSLVHRFVCMLLLV